MFRAAMDANVRGSVLRVAGQLTVEFVKDVDHLCVSADQPVVIDASGLQACDEHGLACLAGLRDTGVSVEGLSEYLEINVRACKERSAVVPGTRDKN